MNPFDQFDHSRSGFYKPNARALAALSQLVYGDREEVTSTGLKWGFHVDFHEIDETECALFTRFDMSFAVLAFRGTSSLEDAITDADFLLERSGLAGKVHSGFNESLAKVWGKNGSLRKVLEGFEDAFNRPLNLFLTGHSLGAGIATIAASELLTMGLGHSIRALYTFGSPRVGNWIFARAITKALKGRFWRVEHNNDIVTRIPPTWLFYRHAGERVYITSDGRLLVNPSAWTVFWDRLRGRAEDFGDLGTDGGKDHSIARYVEQLERIDV